MTQEELQEGLALEDIIREFSDNPADPKKEAEPMADTISLEEIVQAYGEMAEKEEASPIQVASEEAPAEVTGDTQRFACVSEKAAEEVTAEDTVSVAPPTEDTIVVELPTEETQKTPIIIPHPRTKLQEMRRKIVEGPEHSYYALRQKGMAKLQLCFVLSLFVAAVSVGTTILFSMGMVEADRMRLLVFGQLFMLLLSALLGAFQIIDGIFELRRLRFTPGTLLAFTFAICCADCVNCLQTLRVPATAAFCLQVSMALWADCQQRKTETLRMDTMRRAVKVVGIVAEEEYLEGRKGFLRSEGDVDDFMNTHDKLSAPQKVLNWYSLGAFVAAIAICVTGGVLHGWGYGIQIGGATLLVAVPATMFVTISRPAVLLERRLHSLGTVFCGWQGVKGLSGKAVFPVTHEDLFPEGTIKLNGVKFYGEMPPAQVAGYAAAVAAREQGSLSAILEQLRDSHNGTVYEAESLKHYSGGIGGGVEGVVVLVGTLPFLKSLEIPIPEDVHMAGGLGVAIDGTFSCLLAVNYERTRAVANGLNVLGSYHGLSPVMISNDFVLSGRFMQNKFGIHPKKFLRPEPEVRDGLQARTPEEDSPVLALAIKPSLPAFGYTVAGARAYRLAALLGTAVHMIGGIAGLGAMLVLAILGTPNLLTPWNILLYQAAWMIPGLLLTEWTRAI